MYSSDNHFSSVATFFFLIYIYFALSIYLFYIFLCSYIYTHVFIYLYFSIFNSLQHFVLLMLHEKIYENKVWLTDILNHREISEPQQVNTLNYLK